LSSGCRLNKGTTQARVECFVPVRLEMAEALSRYLNIAGLFCYLVQHSGWPQPVHREQGCRESTSEADTKIILQGAEVPGNPAPDHSDNGLQFIATLFLAAVFAQECGYLLTVLLPLL